LYFVTDAARDDTFLRAQRTIESDREYVRKFVVAESELDRLLAQVSFADDLTAGLPPDALSVWTDLLEQHRLGFIVDENLKVPAIVRHIEAGEPQVLLRAPTAPQVGGADRAVADDRLANLSIAHFRKYPIKREFSFGSVNLILGVNGVGKTSLLEAIEYVFCGATRRGGSIQANASVSALLERSNLTLQTTATTAPATLRSRHLAWYGKSEVRRLTLDDSFSKFNFLDTDAAVRLTVESSSERISQDLTQLLLGAEAAKALDRFERVAKQLLDSKKTLDADMRVRESRRQQSEQRLQQLRNAPRESDQLFVDLVRLLESVGWKQRPNASKAVEEVSTSLGAAIVSLGVLRTLPDIGDFQSIDSAASELAGVEQTVSALVTAATAQREERARATARLSGVTKRIEAIDPVIPMVAVGLAQLYQKRESLEKRVSEIEATLPEAERAEATLPPDAAFRRLSLSKALRDRNEAIKQADKAIDQTRAALAALERNQSILVSLQQRLRASARELMEHTHDGTHCPLCQAEYTAAELEKRLNDVARGAVSDESDNLRAQLHDAETVRERCVSEHRALEILQRYTQADDAKATVESAVRAVAAGREALAPAQVELMSTQSILKSHEEKGWSVTRLAELSIATGLEEPLTVESLEAARTAARTEQQQIIEAIEKIDANAANTRAQLSEVAARFGISEATGADVLKAVSLHKRTADERRGAIERLRSVLDLQQSPVTELETRLREAQDIAVRLRTALAREARDSGESATESKALADAAAEIAGLQVKLERVESADAVIQDLLSHHSERALADTVLRENATRIASTFAKIHAPNEFEVRTEDGFKIVRRGGGAVGLEEMSSGQRAAYALSLFLAMNERLRTGPKVIIFDDPVAHVDDINILSLFDHLRDIALTGQRQIFFATADAKIGGLFGRKFRFLGDDFKQIDLTREDAS
jgi:DNA repair exonuclease SbcCD ATPase subunit